MYKLYIGVVVIMMSTGCGVRKVVPGEFRVNLTPVELAEMVAVRESGVVEEVKKIREDVIKTRSQIKMMVDECICPNSGK